MPNQSQRKQPKKGNSAQQKQKARRRNRYIRRTLLVVMEVLLIAVLAICCYGVSLFNNLQRDSTFDINQVYVATFPALDNPVAAPTQSEADTQAATAQTEGFTVEMVTLDELVTEQQYENVLSFPEPPEETDPPAQVTVDHAVDDILGSQRLVAGNYWNILLVGVDARVQANLTAKGTQSDVMIICSINISNKTIRLASIYRDTLLKMYSQNRFNKANAELASTGNPGMLLSMINMNLDLQITDIVIVNWAALVLYINDIGGIDLDITPAEVLNPPYVINGYIDEIVKSTGLYSTQITSPGYQHVDGVQAVAYCRNRYTVNNDYERTQRQRDVIYRILEKTKFCVQTDVSSVINGISDASGNVFTTLSINDIFRLAMYATQFQITDTCGFPFDKNGDGGYSLGVGGAVVPINLAANVSQLYYFLYGIEGYQPSATVQAISDQIGAAEGY